MLKLDISGVRYELDDQIRRYVEKKIGKFDRFIPKSNRDPAMGTVVLTEEDGKAADRFTCEVTIDGLPQGVVTAKDSTINMYAAVDIVAEKVKQQMLRQKDKRTKRRHMQRGRRMLKQFGFEAPWGRPADEEEPADEE